ncbi:MAG TPA: 16S rRNA (guanine(527)-N(7))-methyltransferase RsmG [Terriglobales bacterium]|nr:16S rRNA (guanine(527)-N(7))-methyltransferase RsmG [Terriglobales bacterium]
MDATRISELLAPFLGEEKLAEHQLENISTYIDVLLKWNARMNLTAVREPEQIVQRHFGESLFAARMLIASGSTLSAVDVGSGAGFPGIPMKIYAPGLRSTLIESHGKKATFLREICRTLELTNIDVFCGRAEDWKGTSELVTLRAVERFDLILPIAAALVAPQGRLALLIAAGQTTGLEKRLEGDWSDSIPVPNSRERVLKIWQRL